MSSYGSSIPGKYIWKTTVAQWTRTAFARRMVRDLVRVGMVLQPGFSAPDLTDPTMAQFQLSANDLVTWFFDFPTSDTYTVNGIAYRPCLVFWIGGGQGSQGSNQNDGGGFMLATRPSGAFDPATVTSYGSQRYASSNQGVGTAGTTNQTAILGLTHYDWTWLVYEGEVNAGVHPTRKNIGNFFIALGPGGLQVSVGADATKLGFSSIIGFIIPFFGARIPSRGLSPSSDPNLTRLNPTCMVPFLSTDSEFTNNAGTLTSWVQGGQYNLINTVLPIAFPMYNLENVEQPAFPSYVAPTLRSPRIISGTPRHILNRCVAFANQRRTTTTEFYSFIDTQIDGSVARPPWTEFWDAPGFRFADRIAPNGLFQDPLTSLHWFLSYCTTCNAMLALAFESMTDSSGVNADWSSIGTTDSYDVTASGFASTFPTTTVFQTAVGGNGTWTAIAANNQFHCSRTFAGAGSYGGIDILITRNPADAEGTAYDLVFDLRCRRTGGTSNQICADLGISTNTDGSVTATPGVGTRAVQTFPCGVASGDTNFDFTTYSFPLNMNNAKKFHFLIRNLDTVTTGGTIDLTIQNVRIRRRTKP